MKPATVIAFVIVFIWMIIAGHVIDRQSDRLDAIEAALAAPAPVTPAAAPAAPAAPAGQARYEWLYQVTRDANAAARYVTERARAADRAHEPTPRSNSR